ncbi:MAG: hypothetical protein CVV27_06715 [Candidatus Melainabacteria bacterium HGW-Melainabacteria-1]|nr:MAG: hypothetical protein CVV27_06715 [Candidatus Melainabacteria bacterium HGW-Melainabacteria-1]
MDIPAQDPTAAYALRRKIWLTLAIFGTTFPNTFFMTEYLIAGFDLQVAWQLATANWIARGVTADVLTASLIFWVWAGFELQRKGELGKVWVYVALALGLGLSCALPIFMYRHGRQD